MSRARRSFGLAALAFLLGACSPPAPNPEIVAELRGYDEAFASLERGMKATPGPLSGEEDFRGKRYEQEMAQWVLTPDTRGVLTELRKRAASASNVRATTALLGEARTLLAEDAKRAAGITAYWTSALPAPYWRNYWNQFFIANQEPVASPDPLLLSIEARMRDALDRGEFQRAADEAQMMSPALSEALNRVAGELVKSHKDKVTFVARRSPCTPGVPPDRNAGRPRIQANEEIESYYPSSAKSAGVQGTVVLRVNVDRAGCARQVGIVVHSGVPELDKAALDWFETARFAAAWRGGGTVDSNMMFKVRFQMTDGPDPHSSRE